MKTLLALLALVLATANAAHAEFRWEHFGADPYAATRADAMKVRESAFRSLGLPAGATALLMEATRKPGEPMKLVNGDHLSAMLSKGGVVHKDVTVAFVRPPESGKMEYAAPAEKWQVEWQGRAYEAILPAICNNWSYTTTDTDCVEESFDAPVGGQVRWGIGSALGPMPPSACNAQRQGRGPWYAWYGRCDWCVGALGYIRGLLGSSRAEIHHKYLYTVTDTRQTIRFDRRVTRDVVYVCIEDANGVQTCGVYTRPEDWKGKSRIDVPNSFWRTDCH